MKCLFFLFVCVATACAETAPLRLVCWNIRHGKGIDEKIDLERIAKVIRDTKPDLVALQEVDNQCTRSGKIDQTAELARLTGMKGLFGKAMDYGGGAYGQAILSRHPIHSTKVHPLPSGKEPRIAFEAVVSIAGKDVRIISTHFDLDATKRVSQAEFLAKLVTKGQPSVLCGDFNATPDSVPMGILKKSWQPVAKMGQAFTHPAENPDVEIDHILTRRMTAAEAIVILPERVASDHRPLFAELRRDKDE